VWRLSCLYFFFLLILLYDNAGTRASVKACSIWMACSRACPTIGPNRPPPLHLQYDGFIQKKNKNTATFLFPTATRMRPPRAHPRRRPPVVFSNPAAFSSRSLPVWTPCARSTSLLPRTHPMSLSPARRTRRPPRQAKSGAASDGGGGRATPPPTPTAGIARAGLQHVASACLKCFICFRRYVSSVSCGRCKVDRDVAYVVMIIHVCCKCLFPMFHLFFSDVYCKCALSGYCICFTHMLQVFLSGCCICLQLFF
jgi:hypothetical protein